MLLHTSAKSKYQNEETNQTNQRTHHNERIMIDKTCLKMEST